MITETQDSQARNWQRLQRGGLLKSMRARTATCKMETEPGLPLGARDWARLPYSSANIQVPTFVKGSCKKHPMTPLSEAPALWPSIGIEKEGKSLRRETKSDCLLASWICDIPQLIIEQEYIKRYNKSQLWTGPEASGKDNSKTTKAFSEGGRMERNNTKKWKSLTFKQISTLKYQIY